MGYCVKQPIRVLCWNVSAEELEEARTAERQAESNVVDAQLARDRRPVERLAAHDHIRERRVDSLPNVGREGVDGVAHQHNPRLRGQGGSEAAPSGLGLAWRWLALACLPATPQNPAREMTSRLRLACHRSCCLWSRSACTSCARHPRQQPAPPAQSQTPCRRSRPPPRRTSTRRRPALPRRAAPRGRGDGGAPRGPERLPFFVSARRSPSSSSGAQKSLRRGNPQLGLSLLGTSRRQSLSEFEQCLGAFRPVCRCQLCHACSPPAS